jgi:F0F1-type ATP synthase membrane subunit b/b'
MKKLEEILKSAKEESKVIAENIKAKTRARIKEQDRLHALDIEWSFKEITEQHDSNHCEWLVTGSKDGIDYFASVFSDAINPQFDEPVFDIEIVDI